MMPILPLDHPEPYAATLGVMLYPGEDELDSKRARAWAAQYLAEPVRLFLQTGGVLTYDVLARLHADCGMPLDNLSVRWRNGVATGQMFEVYFKTAHSHPRFASWENSARVVGAHFRADDVQVSPSLLKKARIQYRPVAHLWGAWCLRGQKIWSKPEVGYEAWHDFQFFLEEAEFLLQWGRTWRSMRARAEPPLSGEAWRVPANWRPPVDQPDWPKPRINMAIAEEHLAHLRSAGRPKKLA